MGFFATFFAILGASYVAWLLMKFIVWIDGADLIDAEEEASVAEADTASPERYPRRQNAA